MASRPSARQSSSRETAASLGVLVALVAVAVWLWLAQQRFSPAVTVAISAAKAAEASHVATPTPAAVSDLLTPLPAGLRAVSPAESFSPGTLSDKIDGKAELYLSAGFAGMRCQRVAPDATPTAWFEAFIYEMATPENAFAVYSSQKRSTTTEAGVGDYGYRAGNQLCLIHGRYYLELVGASDSETTLQAATVLAREFIAATPLDRHANVARDEALFPTVDRVEGSLMLLSADVFGFDRLNNTYVARYRVGTDTITLFLSRRGTTTDAATLAKALRGFFVEDCGGKELPPPPSPAGAVIIDSGGSFDGIFASGSFVAGVHQAPSRASAEQWMQRLAIRLNPTAP